MNQLSSVLESTNRMAGSLVNNDTMHTALGIFFILYGAAIAPNPPPFLKSTFANTFVKIALIALAVVYVKVNVPLAIIISLSVVLGSNYLSDRGIFESMTDDAFTYSKFSKKYVTESAMKILEPKTSIHQGCAKITLKDLLDAFEGDKPKIQKTVRYAFRELLRKFKKDSTSSQRLLRMARAAGLPYNLDVNDENAPFIATLLVQWGFNFGGECKL
jgi:hypothetical protein